MRIAHVHRDELRVSEGVHGGAGHILIKNLWGEGDFQVPWRFVDFAILLPGGGSCKSSSRFSIAAFEVLSHY